MLKTVLIMSMLFSLLHHTASAQTKSLQKEIEQLIASKKATVGVSIYGLESKDAVSINGNNHYPMQSVFKFHIAVAVLNEVDRGKQSLHKIIGLSI